MMDQDYQTMVRMRASENVYRVLDRLKNMHGAEIHSLTDSERKLIKRLREQGYI